MVRERSLSRIFFTNLWNSLKPRKLWGTHVGTDYNGTKYYESETAHLTKRQRPPRWFVPPEKDNFEQDIPPEWEAWLRYRRPDPPTEEEMNKNLERMARMKENVAALESEKPVGLRSEPTKILTSKDFPIYEDMEGMPGGSTQGRRGGREK